MTGDGAPAGSTESEIRRIVADLGAGAHFLGTFDKRFPGFVRSQAPATAIVNTAGRETGGVHWLAFGWDPQTRTVTMFEPYGFADERLRQIYHFEYEGLLRRSALGQGDGSRCVELVKSTDSVQGPRSAACGLFCCLFVAAFEANRQNALGDANPVMGPVQGVPNARLRSPDAQPVLRANQEYLYRYLQQHSSYFRQNEGRIRAATAFDRMPPPP